VRRAPGVPDDHLHDTSLKSCIIGRRVAIIF
jgi:hypothetical protein